MNKDSGQRESTNTIEHKLDFAVIGAQKCATSWLYYCLREHPQICVPRKKLEPGYIGGDMFTQQGEDWFFGRFDWKSRHSVLGDVSVDYLYDCNSAHTLARYARELKVIVSIRDPVDRFISSYYWLLRKRKLEVIDIVSGIEPVLAQSPGFPAKLDGPLEEVVRRGCYSGQIAEYARTFGFRNLLVLLYEDIAEAPEQQIKRVYDFLGVDPAFIPASLTSRPKQNSYNPLLMAIERASRNTLIAKLANIANQMVATISPGHHGLTHQDLTRLQELYQPDVDRLLDLFSAFSPPHAPSIEDIATKWKWPIGKPGYYQVSL